MTILISMNDLEIANKYSIERMPAWQKNGAKINSHHLGCRTDGAKQTRHDPHWAVNMREESFVAGAKIIQSIFALWGADAILETTSITYKRTSHSLQKRGSVSSLSCPNFCC